MKARLVVALACALGTFIATAAPAVAVEPVVVVDTDKPEVGPAASTTFLAWIVFSGKNLNPNIRAEAIGVGHSTPGLCISWLGCKQHPLPEG